MARKGKNKEETRKSTTVPEGVSLFPELPFFPVPQPQRQFFHSLRKLSSVYVCAWSCARVD
jgi:hypothetical protein